MNFTRLHFLSLSATLVCSLHLMSCQKKDGKPQAKPKATSAKHSVKIVSSRSLGTLDVRTNTGEVVGIECATCHGLDRKSKPESLHQNIVVRHGEVTCDMCHSRGDRSTLHLADGREVLFENTMDLCGQCHGPQTRDYHRGSHGGMTGHWDLTKGPRVRNNCVNCHDPHQPGYPIVDPAPGPRDRFLKTHPKNEGAHD